MSNLKNALIREASRSLTASATRPRQEPSGPATLASRRLALYSLRRHSEYVAVIGHVLGIPPRRIRATPGLTFLTGRPTPWPHARAPLRRCERCPSARGRWQDLDHEGSGPSAPAVTTSCRVEGWRGTQSARLQPPPDRTAHTDSPYAALLPASHQGLCDLSLWARFQAWTEYRTR
jgi:hypothetical protein